MTGEPFDALRAAGAAILETQHAENPSYRQYVAVTLQQVPQRFQANAVDLDIEVLRRLAA